MSDIFLNLAFAVFAGLTIASAILVVALKDLLHAAISLFFCLTGVAALYVLLGADFLGVAQLLIYAGGILVLIIFGVFLTTRIHRGGNLDVKDKKVPMAAGVGIAAAIFGLIAMLISNSNFKTVTPVYKATSKALGNMFLTRYLLAFELISILLLFSMVGAAILVRKELERNS